MTVGRSLVAGLLYAALMSAWAYWREAPFRESYALGFAFYLVSFSALFYLLMNAIDRWGKGSER
jgi:hypothetical protein